MRYLMAVVVGLAVLSLDSLYGMQVSESPLSFELKTGGPTVSELREQYRTLDQQCLELAKRLRSNQEATPANRQSLTEMVERAFRLRQDLQRAEVAESARRLQKILQTIESREGLKSQIVQRRVDELLNPNVDWLKPESEAATANVTGKLKSEPETNRDDIVRQEIIRRENETVLNASLPANALDQPPPGTNSPVDTSALLRTSPSQMRELLIENAQKAKLYRDKTADVRQQIPQARDESTRQNLQANLKHSEGSWKYYQAQFEFAFMQYNEIVRYLETAVGELELQTATAVEKYQSVKHLYDVNSASKSEVMAAQVRPSELKMELQRVQSLLKLYRAAGESPEVAEVRKPSGSNLGLNIGNAKLGVPKWIEGNGGLTTSPGGYAIVSNDQVGLVAQVLFAEIPDHKDAQLVLSVQTPVSVSEALRSRGVAKTDWVTVREVSISDAEIQAAIDGKSFRKSYFLKSDGSLVEKDTGNEAANSEKDPLVATIELAVQ